MFGGYSLATLFFGESGLYGSMTIYDPSGLANDFIDYTPEQIPKATYAVASIDDSGNYGLE